MKEIKFKFYDKKTRKLIEICDMWWNYIEYLNPKNVIVCQYTGLLDKQGKEIYDGDIIEYTDMKVVCSWALVVEMSHGCWIAGCRMDDEYACKHCEEARGFWFLHQIASKSTIIANIYENPDFLEEEK